MKKLLLASLVSLVAVSSAYAKEYSIKAENEMCAKTPSSIFCQSETVVEAKSMGKKDPYMSTLESVNKEVWSHWKQTPEKVDVWNSYGELFINNNLPKNKQIVGDCEDLAMTTIEYAISKGIPKERLGRIIVKSYPAYRDGIIDEDAMEIHMTAYYYSPEKNEYYYFGDSYYDYVTRVDLSTHKPIMINMMTDGLSWIKY